MRAHLLHAGRIFKIMKEAVLSYDTDTNPHKIHSVNLNDSFENDEFTKSKLVVES